MIRKALLYGAILIGTYLAVSNATGGGKILSSGADGSVKIIKAFQGRN